MIFDSLSNDGMILEGGKSAKKIDESNIDYVIDSILTVCPDASLAYLEMVEGMISRSRK
jgi:hypothetical protein